MAARKKLRQTVPPRPRRKALAPGKAGDASPQQLLAEARAQQAATAEILKVISDSPTDVQPVLDAIVNSAMRLFEPWRAVVLLREGDMIDISAASEIGLAQSDMAEMRKVFPAPYDPGKLMVARAIEDRRLIEVPDTESPPEQYPLITKTARAGRYRSAVFVPLIREGEGIGVIVLTHPTSGSRLPENQLSLVQTFANQAMIAIENVRLFTETKEALERQTATAEILKVIAGSPSDVQPVFDAIVASALHLMRGATAHVTRLEGGQLQLVAYSKTDERGADALRQVYPMDLESYPRLAEALANRTPRMVADVETEPTLSDTARAAMRARGVRSNVVMPMVLKGASIGTLVVNRTYAGGFTPHEIALLKTFADQAVIAIENVRLFNETREALERQTATAEILKVIASSPSDVQPVFDAIANAALRLLGGHSSAVTRVVDGMVHLSAHNANSREGSEALKGFYPRALSSMRGLAQAVRSGEPAYVSDTESDPEMSEEAKELARSRGYRSLLWVPMLREGVAFGTINVSRREPGPFTDNQIGLLKTFADQAVIAVENVRLFNETKALNEERMARLKSFFSPQLAELLAAGKGEELLKTHRREITVQFFDLRGFTAFTGAAEPEEVMELLRDFHGALGKLVMEHEGTIERFAGDSVMVFFNDPLPVERPAERAVQSALALMRAFDPIATRWEKRGYKLGLGAGIAQGFATLGAIGFEGRRDYAAIGPVTNLAARLCAEAKGGQVLVDRKTAASLEGVFDFDAVGPFQLKGFAQSVPAFALVGQSKA